MEKEGRNTLAHQTLAEHEKQRRQLLAVRMHLEDARMLLERVTRRERQKREGGLRVCVRERVGMGVREKRDQTKTGECGRGRGRSRVRACVCACACTHACVRNWISCLPALLPACMVLSLRACTCAATHVRSSASQMKAITTDKQMQMRAVAKAAQEVWRCRLGPALGLARSTSSAPSLGLSDNPHPSLLQSQVTSSSTLQHRGADVI